MWVMELVKYEECNDFFVPIPGVSARTSGRSQEVVMGKNQQQNKVKLYMIINVITWIII